MGIKEVFGLHKINKNILLYALGTATFGIGLGSLLRIYANLSTSVSLVILIIGFIMAHLFYNRILTNNSG